MGSSPLLQAYPRYKQRYKPIAPMLSKGLKSNLACDIIEQKCNKEFRALTGRAGQQF
jgi:hypothetical protein